MKRPLLFIIVLGSISCHNLIITPTVISAPDAGAGDVFYNAVLDCEKPAANIGDLVTPCLDKASKSSTVQAERPCLDVATTNTCLTKLYPNHTLDEIGCKVIDLDMVLHVAITSQTASPAMANEAGAADLWIQCERLGAK
jgi:hypothetical protein